MIRSSLITIALGVVLFSCGNEVKKEVKEETKAPETSKQIDEPKKQIETVEVVQDEVNCSTELAVYLNDPDLSGTNIRNSPKGKKLFQLVKKDEESEFFITVTESEAGWFKITSIEDMEGVLDKDYSSAWIHGSVLGVDTRNYGGEEIKLYSNANSSEVIGKITSQEYGLSLVDICGDWVRVKNKTINGWVKKDWLCGSPITTCS